MENLQPAEAPVQEYFRHYGLDFETSLPGVSHHIGLFESGHYDLACQLFLREGSRGTVFVVHGYFDHVGLYSSLIGHLLSKNYSVIAFDLPGHGLSSGERASIPSFSHYDQALSDCVARCHGELPTPWHVIGQSTGGAAVMSFIMRQRHPVFDGVVLLAPLVRPLHWHLGRLAYGALGRFRDQMPRRFNVNSHDTEFLEFVASGDPLQSRHLKLAWVAALDQWLKWFLQLPASSAALLVVQGESDATVDWRYNLKVIAKKFPDAKFIRLVDAHHHLVGESGEVRGEVFEAIDRYLDGKPPLQNTPASEDRPDG